MKRYLIPIAILALVAGASGAAVADAGPLADAGLDQEVPINATVQIDATGSSHPNGTIDDYEWAIATPDGRQITPECADCARTQFTPETAGRYEVTVTVTDTEGRSNADTLYVYVEDAGPSVELSGPTEPRVNEPVEFNATAETSGAELENVTWRIDDEAVTTDSMGGARDSSERSMSFSDSEKHRIAVVVNDSEGRSARDTLVVEPRERNDQPTTSSPDDFESSQTSGSESHDSIDRDVSDCRNGVFVSGNAGCIGHVSDTSHDDQSEGCEEDFCGVVNPAKEHDFFDSNSKDSGSSTTDYSDYGSSQDNAGNINNNNNNGRTADGSKNDAGHIRGYL